MAASEVDKLKKRITELEAEKIAFTECIDRLGDKIAAQALDVERMEYEVKQLKHRSATTARIARSRGYAEGKAAQ